jgi:hypothetical protein
MARSRYSETDIIDGNHYATWSLPVRARGLRELDLLSGVKTQEHTFRRGERLDLIAARVWGEDTYWWIIALVNGISYPFASGGLVPGRVLKIPVNVQDILQKIFK